MSEYKKYSLENLENWMHDAMSCAEASPQEIYDVIKGVVQENYYIYKHKVSQAYELLALLNGNGKGHLTCDKDDPSPECKGDWNSFWEENYYPEEHKKTREPKVEDIMPSWGHSDMEALRYTEEELNVMCDKAASDEEKNQCREYNLREAEYYNKREEISRNDPNRIDYKDGLIYESPDNGKTVYARKPGETNRTLVKEDKPKRWVLPVEQNPEDFDYIVSFPDDLLEAADLKEGDEIEWVEQKDGSYLLRKVNKIAHHPV